MSTSRLIGSSSEPSLSLVCHPLIFISLTLCGIPPSRSLGARRALYFLSNLARVPLPPSPPSIRPKSSSLTMALTRSWPGKRPTAADRIGGLKRKGEGERDHLLARPRDLCEMVIMLTSQDCVGSGERKRRLRRPRNCMIRLASLSGTIPAICPIPICIYLYWVDECAIK